MLKHRTFQGALFKGDEHLTLCAMVPRIPERAGQARTKTRLKAVFRFAFVIGATITALIIVRISHNGFPLQIGIIITLMVLSLGIGRILFADIAKTFFKIWIGVIVLCVLFWGGLNVRHIYTGQSILWDFTPSPGVYAWKAEGCDPTSVICKVQGVCGFEKGQCKATAVGCMRSGVCLTEGRCGFHDGECIPTKQGCSEASSLCLASGKCGFEAGECIATAEGCQFSTWACKRLGKCGFADGACVATAAGCARSDFCKRLRQCKLEDGVCTSVSEKM